MKELGIRIKDVVSERYIPTAEASNIIAHIRNLFVKYKTPIVVVTEDDEVIGKISIKDFAITILKNIRVIQKITNLLAKDIARELPETLPSVEEDIKEGIDLILKSKDAILTIDPKTNEFMALEAEDILGKTYELYDEITISEICDKNVLTGSPHNSIVQLYKKMYEKGYDSIIILNTLKRPIGIITYSDIVYYPFEMIYRDKYVAKDETGRVITAKDKYPAAQEVMSEDVYFLLYTEKCKRAAREMFERKIGHIPVVYEDYTLYGLLNKYHLLNLL